MARTPRPAPDHLSYLRRAAARAALLSPLALLRGAEARAPQLPRIGNAKLPAEDIVTLAHAPTLAFPAATLDHIVVDDARAVITGHWLGLTGAMGPLPLHLTEYAARERREGRSRPFGRFLDVLAGRMLQRFYRAWASGSPAASADRTSDDYFAQMLADLSGARDGAVPGSAFPAPARLRYAWLFASLRSPAAIGDALSDLLRQPVRIIEHVERWRGIEGEDQTRLGRSYATLGRGALAGARVQTAEEAFKVVVGVATAAQLRDVLPGGPRYARLVAAVAAFAPPQLESVIELAVAGTAIRPARLGSNVQLGWSGWIGPPEPGRIRTDTRLGAHAARRAPSTRLEIAA